MGDAGLCRHAVTLPVDGRTAPGAQTGKILVYVDTADGDLKVKFGDGVTKVIAADT